MDQAYALEWYPGKSGRRNNLKMMEIVDNMEFFFKVHSKTPKEQFKTFVSNPIPGSGETLLTYACYHGPDSAVLQLVQEGGADANQQGIIALKKGQAYMTPMGCAASQGKVMLMHWLNTEAQAPLDGPMEFGRTPLGYAARYNQLAALKYLIEHQVPINVRDDKGRTPLMEASSQGHTECVIKLLEAKADPNVQDTTRSTALHHAAKGGHDLVIKLLIAHHAATYVDQFGLTPAETAAWAARVSTVSICLLNRTDNKELVRAYKLLGARRVVTMTEKETLDWMEKYKQLEAEIPIPDASDLQHPVHQLLAVRTPEETVLAQQQYNVKLLIQVVGETSDLVTEEL